MKKNVGKTCPVCKKTFVESDDIVVCPECGTPHHRSCYASIGRCALSSKHGCINKDEEKKQNEIEFQQKEMVVEEIHKTFHTSMNISAVLLAEGKTLRTLYSAQAAGIR